jgi:hypothetical protein
LHIYFFLCGVSSMLFPHKESEMGCVHLFASGEGTEKMTHT